MLVYPYMHLIGKRIFNKFWTCVYVYTKTRSQRQTMSGMPEAGSWREVHQDAHDWPPGRPLERR